MDDLIEEHFTPIIFDILNRLQILVRKDLNNFLEGLPGQGKSVFIFFAKKSTKVFLPEQMPDDQLAELVSKIISEVGAQDMKDMGKVMGSLKPLIAGKADAGFVSQLVKKALS